MYKYHPYTKIHTLQLLMCSGCEKQSISACTLFPIHLKGVSYTRFEQVVGINFGRNKEQV
jgi:hypothetical protein